MYPFIYIYNAQIIFLTRQLFRSHFTAAGVYEYMNEAHFSLPPFFGGIIYLITFIIGSINISPFLYKFIARFCFRVNIDLFATFMACFCADFGTLLLVIFIVPKMIIDLSLPLPITEYFNRIPELFTVCIILLNFIFLNRFINNLSKKQTVILVSIKPALLWVILLCLF